MILTLEETLNEQKDLGKLCADRELKTPELFAPNDYYGSAHIFKLHAGLPIDKPLKAIIPHGVTFSHKDVWDEEVKSRLPAIFYYVEHARRLYEERTDKLLVPSASPYLYVQSLLKSQPVPQRKGTLFFPAHSTHHVTSIADHEELSEMLQSLDDEYKPVTICVYWRDYNLGHHKPFIKKGFEVVSAGHMYDPNFLFRLHHLCSMHKYAASNAFSSSLFYAVKSGCPYFFMDFEFKMHAPSQVLERDCSKDTTTDKEISGLFKSPSPQISREQLNVIDYYLGAEYFRTPDELARQLEHAEKLDKFGFISRDAGGHARLKVPCYYLRLIDKVRHPFEVAMHKLQRQVKPAGE